MVDILAVVEEGVEDIADRDSVPYHHVIVIIEIETNGIIVTKEITITIIEMSTILVNPTEVTEEDIAADIVDNAVDIEDHEAEAEDVVQTREAAREVEVTEVVTVEDLEDEDEVSNEEEVDIVVEEEMVDRILMEIKGLTDQRSSL